MNYVICSFILAKNIILEHSGIYILSQDLYRVIFFYKKYDHEPCTLLYLCLVTTKPMKIYKINQVNLPQEKSNFK